MALAALAFFLRASCAVLTEFKPLFPSYYYTDARLFHNAAVFYMEIAPSGARPPINGSLCDRFQILTTLTAYRVFGPRPISIKLINAALGALGVVALTWAFGFVFDSRATLLAGAALAVWPSAVFYTSQNLKESPTQLLVFAGLGSLLALALDERSSQARAAALAAGAAVGLLGAGMYRSFLLIAFGVALAPTLGLQAFMRPRGRAAWALALLLAAPVAYPAVSRLFLNIFSGSDPARISYAEDGRPETAYFNGDQSRAYPRLFPSVVDSADTPRVHRSISPEGLTLFRRNRQISDRGWARAYSGREIATQLFPDAAFSSWLDVLVFLPKAAFHVLFMPLPGFYPLDGRIGRVLAALENAVLLAVSLAALAGIARGCKTPARMGLLAFFAVMTVAAASLEFDLGSAGRHKALYLPMLFPFAAEELLRRLGRKEPA